MVKAVSILVTGDKQLNRMLSRLKRTEAAKIVRKAARAGVKVVVPTVKRNAPVGATGRLRRNIKVRALKRSRGRIGARITIGNENFQGETFYGGFQEWGWRLGKRVNINKSKGFTDARRKIPGKFFMKKAADQKRRSALIVYRHAIKQGIEAHARAHGAR